MDEFKSTPIQFTVAIVSLVTLIVGGLSSMSLFETAQTQDIEIAQNGALYALTMSVAITFTCAMAVKFMPSGIPTFVGSIVIASINLFLVVHIIDSNLIGGLHGQQLNSARNVGFYGVMAIYSIFNLRISVDESTDGGGLIVSIIFLHVCGVVWFQRVKDI
ncbi:hypothetical protein [Aeromonas piscicola]|uniref:hypothetical protein n=1 Tax=Aeromonas piscicola TaxID=600645 RepID=UPI0012E02660|nr:hypothetical protein [Aeromonas piscicola]